MAEGYLPVKRLAGLSVYPLLLPSHRTFVAFGFYIRLLYSKLRARIKYIDAEARNWRIIETMSVVVTHKLGNAVSISQE